MIKYLNLLSYSRERNFGLYVCVIHLKWQLSENHEAKEVMVESTLLRFKQCFHLYKSLEMEYLCKQISYGRLFLKFTYRFWKLSMLYYSTKLKIHIFGQAQQLDLLHTFLNHSYMQVQVGCWKPNTLMLLSKAIHFVVWL